MHEQLLVFVVLLVLACGLATIGGSNSSSTTILCDSYACLDAIISNFVSLDAYGALNIYSATITGVTTFNIHRKN